MANAPRDENRVTNLLGTSLIDGRTPVVIWADPSTHELLVKASISFTPSGTQDVNLIQVGGSVFALGQQLAASSLPVVLTASQLSTLTPLSTVAVTQSTSPWVISGTVTANQGGTWNINNISGTISLPTGASTLAEQQTQTTALGTLLTTSAFQARINTFGQKAMAASTPIVIASDQTAIPVSASGTFSVTQGTSPWIVAGGGTAGTAASGVVTIQGIASMTPVQIADNGGSITVDGTVAFSNTTIAVTNAGTFAVQATQSGTWTVATNADLITGSGSGIGGSQVMLLVGGVTYGGTSAPQAIKVDTNGYIYNVSARASSSTLSNVAASASSVTVLALASDRLGATIVNDSTAQLYLKFGSTASATSYTYTLFQYETLEVPFGYTGIITGIWASATGAARVTELKA